MSLPVGSRRVIFAWVLLRIVFLGVVLLRIVFLGVFLLWVVFLRVWERSSLQRQGGDHLSAARQRPTQSLASGVGTYVGQLGRLRRSWFLLGR